MKPRALLLAEKPSLLRTIKAVYEKHKDSIPYDITFVAQSGHILRLLLPSELDKEHDWAHWSYELVPFFPDEQMGYKYTVINAKRVGNYPTPQEIFAKIKTELKSGKYDLVINAGDPDQEGELLIDETLKYLKNTLPVKRYWSNDTTDDAVLNALLNLRDDDADPLLVNLRGAAYARQHFDYIVGTNVSVVASLRMKITAAVGRVMTAVLSLVCKREDDIKNFVPRTTYSVSTEFEKDGIDFKAGLLDEEGQALFFENKQDAVDILNALDDTSKIIEYETTREQSLAPKLFKLDTAQIAAGRLGYSPKQTLDIIQRLYQQGYISYPRTDCEYISSGMDLPAMLRSAMSVAVLVPFIKTISKSTIGKVHATKKWVNDKALLESGHSALTPTTKAPDLSALSNSERDIYSMICRRFVAIFLPPLIQDKTELILDNNNYHFKAAGKTLVDKGFTAIFDTKLEDNILPILSVNQLLPVQNKEITDKTTKCPTRYTETELVAACVNPAKYLDDDSYKALGKRLHLGTPATRTDIIKKLIDKKYMGISGKYLAPSDIGYLIYENLKDTDICKVDLSGETEEKLEMVRQGQMSYDDMEKFSKTFVNTMINSIKNSTTIKESKRPSNGKNTDYPIINKCPVCGQDVVLSPKGFYCRNYKTCGYSVYLGFKGYKPKESDAKRLMNGDIITIKLTGQYGKYDQKVKVVDNKLEFIKKNKKSS